ncbi:MAG: hypothetical protein A2Z03_08200 [Chloroflexi bacterium RBG_16_56_8]|nr:MAG: hypothetical protein A2Z03_08200 [Chloroflexi bacterium RBG_16_56_8]
MFDLERVKKDSGLSPEVLARVEQQVREDFREDDLLFEIHMVRLLRAVKEGRIGIEQILAEPALA